MKVVVYQVCTYPEQSLEASWIASRDLAYLVFRDMARSRAP
jgi:hypothetical protein